MAHLSFIFVSSNRFIMKYKEKEKQKAVKVKGQKRRVVEQSECKKEYSDEEIAQITDYDYGYLLDMMYYKFERMVAFFKSKHTHTLMIMTIWRRLSTSATENALVIIMNYILSVKKKPGTSSSSIWNIV